VDELEYFVGAFKKRIEILEQHRSPSGAVNGASPESPEAFLAQHSSNHKRNKT
jgi:hypothetical protein